MNMHVTSSWAKAHIYLLGICWHNHDGFEVILGGVIWAVSRQAT